MNILFEFNTIEFQILGVPSYFFFSLLGFVIAVCIYIILIASKRYDVTKYTLILLPSFIGMVLGAKLFGILTGIYRDIGTRIPITFKSLFDTGIVYYGGLAGFLITYYLCLRLRRLDLDLMAINVLAVCIPLFHTFARIGCFTSGCCYGKIYTGIFSIKYTTYIAHQIDTNLRFPVQILEAIFNFGLFIYLLILLRSNDWIKKNILIKYLLIYSGGRFAIEFSRGDIRRGVIHGLSFSQTMSISLWIALFGYLMYQKLLLKGKKEKFNG